MAGMRSKFYKYWGTFPVAFCFATIMDPRFKLFALGEWFKCLGLDQLDIDSKLLALKTKMHHLYESYKRKVVADIPHRQSANLASTTLSLAPGSISVHVVGNFLMQSLKARVSSSSSSSAVCSDLQMYFALPTIEVNDDNAFNVLTWWNAIESLYPIVSLMAHDLLTITASTVAFESSFSAGGRVVSEKRASLSPNTIEALICLKDWLLAKSRTHDIIREHEMAEELRRIKAARPDLVENSDDEVENASEAEAKIEDVELNIINF